MYFNDAYVANPAWINGPATRQGVPLLAIAEGGDAAQCRVALNRMTKKEMKATVARALGQVAHLLNTEMLEAVRLGEVTAVRSMFVTAHESWWTLYVRKAPQYGTAEYCEAVHERQRANAQRLAAAAALSAVADNTPQSTWEVIALADDALRA